MGFIERNELSLLFLFILFSLKSYQMMVYSMLQTHSLSNIKLLLIKVYLLIKLNLQKSSLHLVKLLPQINNLFRTMISMINPKALSYLKKSQFYSLKYNYLICL